MTVVIRLVSKGNYFFFRREGYSLGKVNKNSIKEKHFIYDFSMIHKNQGR